MLVAKQVPHLVQIEVLGRRKEPRERNGVVWLSTIVFATCRGGMPIARASSPAVSVRRC